MTSTAAAVVAAGTTTGPGADPAEAPRPRWEPGYKVRIGVAAGAGVIDDPAGYLRLVDALDDLGFDSIWVPDVVTGGVFDPIAALGVATGRRARLKIGSHLIVPGRDPVWLAKQLATLDQLSAGRLLLLAVIGLNQPEELDAQGVVAAERTAMLEESLEVMRALWAGETVHRDGAHGRRYEAVRLAVRPVQEPLEVWLGGQVPAALRRCGRIGDGWMPGLCTPERGRGRHRADPGLDGRGRRGRSTGSTSG